jgi:hypothetical protein
VAPAPELFKTPANLFANRPVTVNYSKEVLALMNPSGASQTESTPCFVRFCPCPKVSL